MPMEMPFIIQPLNYYLFTLQSQVFYEDKELDEIVEEAMINHRAFRYLLLLVLREKEMLVRIGHIDSRVSVRIKNTFDYFFSSTIGEVNYKSQIQKFIKWENNKTEDIESVFENKGIRKDAIDFWKDLTVYRLYCWKEKNKLIS